MGSHVYDHSDEPELVWIDEEVSQIQGEEAISALTNRTTVGKTEVLLKAGQMTELAERRTEVLGCDATIIQRKWRTYSTHKKYLQLQEVTVAIQASCRAKLACNLHERMKQEDASTKIQKYWRRYTIRKSYENIVAKITIIQVGLRAMGARMEFLVRIRNREAIHIQIVKEKSCLEEERRKNLDEEESKKAHMESKGLAVMAEKERPREIEEEEKRKEIEEEESQREVKEIERKKAQLVAENLTITKEKEQQRELEGAVWQKKLEEEDSQRAAKEAEREKPQLEDDILIAIAEQERQREIEEAVRQKKIEQEEIQSADEEAERQKIIEEEERQRTTKETGRAKKLEEEERQRAVGEAEKKEDLEAEWQSEIEEEERRRAFEEVERQKAFAEEEKYRAIEEAERQKSLSEEEMRRDIEEAERQKTLEAERQKALAEAEEGAEIGQLKDVKSDVELKEERIKRLEKEETEKEELEAESLEETAEQGRQREIENDVRWKVLKKEVRRRAAEEAERRKKLEKAERRKKLKEEEQQKVAEEADRQKTLETKRRRKLNNEDGSKEIIGAEWQKSIVDEEKQRAIEEPEKRRILAEEEMQKAFEEAERHMALEDDKQKAHAKEMAMQGAENDQMKSNIEASHESIEKQLAELQEKVGEEDKQIVNGLREAIRRLEEAALSTNTLLQTERQEHDVTKNSLAWRSEALKQAEENNSRIKQLREHMRRIKEDELAVVKEEHEITKIELVAALKRSNQFGKEIDHLNKKVAQLEGNLERHKRIATEKDSLLQTEKQDHDATKNTLAKEKQEHDATKNALGKEKQEKDKTEHDLTKERHEHDETKSAFRISQEKVKELQNELRDADKKIYGLESNLRRLGEEVIEKDESVQLEKRKHESTQRALAQAKEYSEESLKRNEASSCRIDKLHGYIERIEEKAKEVQEKMLKGNQEIYDLRKQVAEAELRNKELFQEVQLADKKIIQLQDALKRIEENAKQREVMLQTEKQQHDETKSSLSSANGKIQQLERQIVQFQEGLKRFEQDVTARILSERQQHDATKRALYDAQRKNQEMQQKVQFWDSTVELLCETNKRPEGKAFVLEQENNSLRRHPSNLERMSSQSSTQRGDMYSEDDKEQNAISEQQQQENRKLLMMSISQYLGFVNGSPVAANLIYKCLVNWKSFEAERTSVFDSLFQKISSVTKGQDDNEAIAYWLSNLSTLVPLLQKMHETSDGPLGQTAVYRGMTSRTSTSMSGSISNFGAAAGSANFIQQLTMLLDKLLATIKENLKNELSSLLNLSIKAPKVSRLSSMKVLGEASGSPTAHWHSIVRILEKYMTVLKSTYVPPFIIQRLFTQIFQIMNAQLFNSLLLRRESCSLSNGELLKAGFEELESWCCVSNEEYAGAAWRELRHIRQAVDFLVAPEKQRNTLMEICNDICPSLTTPQIHRLSTLYWDDKYGTNDISQQVNAEINQMMAREPNRTYMLTEASSPPLTLVELSRSISVYEMRDSDLPISIRNNAGFAFSQQRLY